MKKLIKKEIAEAIATEQNITNKLSKKIVSEVFKKITQALEKGKTCQINGFGTFSFYKKRLRSFKTSFINNGKEIIVPEHQRIKFRLGQSLKNINTSAMKKSKAKTKKK